LLSSSITGAIVASIPSSPITVEEGELTEEEEEEGGGIDTGLR